jgi:hypothetical protein
MALLAQQGRAPLNRDVYQAYQEHLNDKDVDFHTSIKPYLRKDLYRETVLDTVLPPHIFYWMRAIDKPKRELDKWETNWRAGPIVDLSLGADFNDPNNEAIKYVAGGGLFVEADIGPTLTVNLSARSYSAQTVSYVDSFINTWEVMPGMGYAGGGKAPYNFSDLNGYVSFTPHKWFNIQAGRGKNFIGDGYRSLMLSDNAYSYPYLKLETHVWHIKYMVLYTAMKDVRMGPGNSKMHNEKYSTMHYLSWNVSKRINFSFFESIVWQGQDTLVDRGFEMSYLNPMIFFRPVEYSLGSADNALMGFGLKIKIADKSQLYAQFVLDEFLMSEVLTLRK